MFDWFWEFLYRLLKTILYCIDFIMNFANKLVGIEPVYDADNNEVELVNFFLTSEAVLDAFKLVALVGIVLLFLFTAFSVVRAIGRVGEGRSPLGVCLNGAKSILYFLLIPAIMIIGASFVSAVMTSIYRATSGGGGGLGSSLFTLFADEAYNGGGNKEAILDRFRDCGPFAENTQNYNYYSMGDVKDYFSLSKINYFLGFVAGFAVLLLLVKPMMSFVERIVSLVLLFVISPISVASSVLDDGARFKLWRDQVINKFLVAYGSLLSLNIFVLLVEVIYSVTFFPNSSFLNGMARLAFVLGGASACRLGTVLIGNLVNSGAGSQYEQDMKNVSSPLAAIAGAGLAQRALGGISNRVSGALHRKLDPAIHRKSNAKNEVKDKMAQDRYSEKLARRKAQKAPTAKASEAPQATWQKGSIPGAGGGTAQPRDIRDVLIGQRGGQSTPSGGKADEDNAANKAGAATVKDAMKAGKANKSASDGQG